MDEKTKVWRPVLEECPDKRELDAHASGRMIHHEVEIAGKRVMRCEANPGNEEKETLTVTKNWLRADVETLRGALVVGSA